MEQKQVLLEGSYTLRSLQPFDASPLARYFDGLSDATRRRFKPHPLDHQTAASLCERSLAGELRYVVIWGKQIIGYFVLDSHSSQHEAARFLSHGIALQDGVDFLFAPSIADAWQGRGVASLSMPALLQFARVAGARSLVLMGGTQATNVAAIAFYEKLGFQRYGGYYTDMFNHDMRLCLEPV